MSRNKIIALLAVVAMLLTILPSQIGAANADPYSTRLAGSNRVETALQISYAGWDVAEKVVIAPSDQKNLVDALAAAPLAGQENAPILLTPVNKLDPAVKARLISLGARTVYVIGAISSSVTAEIEAMNNVSAIALKGSGRCETAGLVNNLLINPQWTFVVGYNALADALSVASFAAKYRYAIVVADSRGVIPTGQQAVGTKTYKIGGPTLVSNNVAGTRIYGKDRFETNLEVSKALNFSYERVYVANGYQNSLADSLAAAPLAAQYGSFVALADNVRNEVKASGFVNTRISSSTRVIAVGGTSVLSDTLKKKIGASDMPKDQGDYPRGIAPNKVEFGVDSRLNNYDLTKIRLLGNLVITDAYGNTKTNPKSVAIVNDAIENRATVTLTLYGDVADTSFTTYGAIELDHGAFTTVLGSLTSARAAFITSLVDYSPPSNLVSSKVKSLDTDDNGQIDTIEITYSEDINTPSVWPSDYTVEGYVIRDVRVQCKKVFLMLNETGAIDTAATPKVTQVGTIMDNSGNFNVLGPQDAVIATDGAAPKVFGVVHGQAYNRDLRPVFMEGSGKLTKDGGSEEDYNSNTLIVAEGNYVLQVTDTAANITTVNFRIDRVKPTITELVFIPGDLRRITVIFSEDVVVSDVTNKANYEFFDFSSGGVNIQAISYDSLTRKATILLTGDAQSNDSITVKANTIHDLAGNAEELGRVTVK